MKRILLGMAIGSIAFAGTWDVAANFNAANNPSASGVFSYGSGAIPADFAAMVTVTQNCFAASPTECLDNGIGYPGASGIVWNGTGSQLTSGTVNVFPGFVNMDPQLSGGTIVRFTAPWTDIYSMTGNYKGDDSGQHPTTGWVYHGGTSIEAVNVNTFTALTPIGFSNLALSAGETIDFIVTTNSDCCYLGTGLGAVITSQTDGASVPEPGTLLLIPAGLMLAMRRARRA
jgi:hypothetical protein